MLAPVGLRSLRSKEHGFLFLEKLLGRREGCAPEGQPGCGLQGRLQAWVVSIPRHLPGLSASPCLPGAPVWPPPRVSSGRGAQGGDATGT